MANYAFLGSLSFRNVPLSLVKVGDALAFNTADGKVFLVQTSAIPLLSQPIPTPQSSLPKTSGVNLIDLESQDLAYDASRNLLYASTPNSEAALGDRVVAIDPNTRTVVKSYPAGHNPALLALSKDSNRVFLSEGALFNYAEGVRSLDLVSGAITQQFTVSSVNPNFTNNIRDLTTLPGQPQAVAVLDGKHEYVHYPDGTVIAGNQGPDTIRIYDNGIQRPSLLDVRSMGCTAIQPGATAARLYCVSSTTHYPQSPTYFFRLEVNDQGVSLLGSPLSIPPDPSTKNRRILFSNGRVYTTDGFVINPEAMQIITRVEARGPVAVDGDRVYWLDASSSNSSAPSVDIRSFDVSTLQPLQTRPINVTSPNVTRLVACGQGRLAFGAGHEIYIVDPISTATVSVDGVVNAASFVPGAPVAPGSIAAAFGANMVLTPSDEISVKLNGYPAPIYAATATQINLQVPWELEGQSQATLVVTARGISGTPFPIQLASVAPGIFSANSSGSGQGAILIAGTALTAGPPGAGSQPVQRGGVISIYATGLGQVNNRQPTGVAAPNSPLARTNNTPTVSIAGISAPVSFSGLAPSFFGLYQVNVSVPTNVTPGDAVPVVLKVGNATSNTVTIAVQ
jgi:uncharacterized protein (TIGR03437 family)